MPTDHRFVLLRAVGLLAAGVASTMNAQSTKAELLVVVRDPSGLPVREAAVELANTGTGLTTLGSTAEDGAYQFLALPAGDYRLSVSKAGFAVLKRDGITLRVGDRLGLDLDVKLGDASQTVEVRAAAPLLQSNRGTVSFVVEQKKVVTLPLDGRNFVPLIALSPGVNLPPGNLLPRINGSRPRVSEYIYDGISVLQPEPGQVAFYPIIDAIDEFRVETNRLLGGVRPVERRRDHGEPEVRLQ